MDSNLSAYTASGYTSPVELRKGIGLRLALDAITAERTRLEALADVHASSAPATLAYADGRLAHVQRVIAAIFRQATS
jgi:hypothetical protein